MERPTFNEALKQAMLCLEAAKKKSQYEHSAPAANAFATMAIAWTNIAALVAPYGE